VNSLFPIPKHWFVYLIVTFGISALWQHIDDEDERIRRQLGSLRLKERLSQIPSYKEQEKKIGQILWEKLYESTVFSTLLLFVIIVSSRVNDELNVSLRQSGYWVHMVQTGDSL